MHERDALVRSNARSEPVVAIAGERAATCAEITAKEGYASARCEAVARFTGIFVHHASGAQRMVGYCAAHYRAESPGLTVIRDRGLNPLYPHLAAGVFRSTPKQGDRS